MKTEFLSSLSVLKAKAGNSFEVERIQNKEISNSLEGMRGVLDVGLSRMEALGRLLERRTAPLSPTKGFSNAEYSKNYHRISVASTSTFSSALPACPPRLQPAFSMHESTPVTVSRSTPPPLSSDDHGFYFAIDGSPGAFANQSPKSPAIPRSKTHVDLVLPPVSAFYKQGHPPLLWPPVLGQKSVTWDQIFQLIEPESAGVLWDVWKPTKSLNEYTISELWVCYNTGEQVFDDLGTPTGIKPPLRIVEEHFHSAWRKSKNPNVR